MVTQNPWTSGADSTKGEGDISLGLPCKTLCHDALKAVPCGVWPGAQDKRKSVGKQWIGYDSNVAEVDGSLHVFSDAAMSEEEDDDPRRVQGKHVLLDHVPQVTNTVHVISCIPAHAERNSCTLDC